MLGTCLWLVGWRPELVQFWHVGTCAHNPQSILSFVMLFVYASFCRWLVLVHCRWWPWCPTCTKSHSVQVGPEFRTLQDLVWEGYSALDLQDLGVTLDDLYDVGFSIWDLRENAEFNERAFDHAGLSVDLESAGGARFRCRYWLGWLPCHALWVH